MIGCIEGVKSLLGAAVQRTKDSDFEPLSSLHDSNDPKDPERPKRQQQPSEQFSASP